jgi:hypothetical protein
MTNNPVSVINATLTDPSNDKDNIKVRVKVGKYGIYIHADGYGEKTALTVKVSRSSLSYTRDR